MPKKDWKKVFNLNSYEWWRNHRRIVTLALLLFAFGYYVKYPSAEELRNKKLCGIAMGGNREASNKAYEKLVKMGVDSVGYYCQYFE